MEVHEKASAEMTVSVVMPSYNCELYIEKAIRSVMAQTHQNLELLVIDDGSTDGSCSIVEELAACDPRVKLFKNATNMGTARTRNRGLELSRGDFVAFLDSDDTWHPEKLQVQISQIIQSGAEVSYTAYNIIDEHDKIKSVYNVPASIVYEELLKENMIGCSTVLIKRSAVDKFRFRTDFYHEDYCLWLELTRKGHKFVGSTEPLVDWRVLSTSRSFRKGNSAKNRFRIYRDYLNLSFAKSFYLICCYAVRGIKKYYRSLCIPISKKRQRAPL